MLDIKRIRQNPQELIDALKARNKDCLLYTSLDVFHGRSGHVAASFPLVGLPGTEEVPGVALQRLPESLLGLPAQLAAFPNGVQHVGMLGLHALVQACLLYTSRCV